MLITTCCTVLTPAADACSSPSPGMHAAADGPPAEPDSPPAPADEDGDHQRADGRVVEERGRDHDGDHHAHLRPEHGAGLTQHKVHREVQAWRRQQQQQAAAMVSTG
eukprot:GHRQ01039832.1.p1 GENE.GHRQ01039832.1~~GHRQ01039832.1.p1  ORF type:complete len:107 (+),score=13.06 GHRQ01039832.1:231-551(+)